MSNRVIVCAILACFAVTPMAGAQSLVSTGESFASLRLMNGEDGMAGLEITLAPGWKTYWRSPGDAGIPPQFDWSGSENVGAIEVLWPAPHAFDSFGMRTIGYDGVVVLPLQVTPADAGAPVRLHLHANLGVCEEICVFEESTVALDLATAPLEDVALAAALATVPRPGVEMGVTAATCAVRGAGIDRDFSAEIAIADAPADALVLVEGPEETWFGDAVVQAHDGGLTIAAPAAVYGENAWIDRQSLRMTVLADGFAADIQGCDAPS